MYQLSTYSKISVLIIKELREDRSQKAMSDLLGKNYNIYQKFESRHKRVKLSEFVHICESVNINVREIFTHSFEFKTNNTPISEWIKELFTSHPHIVESDIIKHLELSKTSWWRLINHKRTIYLDEFLLLSNYQTQRLNVFLSQLNIDITDQLKTKVYNQAEKLHLKYIYTPELSLVGSAIYLKDVKNAKTKNSKIKKIAKACFLAEHLVSNIINELIDDGLLYITSDNNFEFVYFENTFYSRREESVFNSLKDFSLEKLNERSNNSLRETDRFHIRTACVSKEANQKIDDILRECALKVGKVIKNDSADNRDRIVSFLASKIII